MKNILAAIKTKLATVSTIKTVSLWRNQIAKMEDGKQDSFAFPACFVEFLPGITYQSHLDNQQTAEGTVRIHLVAFELNMTDEAVLALRDVIQSNLQGLQDADQTFSPLSRVGEAPDSEI